MKWFSAAAIAAMVCLGRPEGLHYTSPDVVQTFRSAGLQSTGLQSTGLQTADLPRLQSVGDVHLSPDAARVAYSVVRRDRRGRPYSQVWIMDLATRRSTRLGAAEGTASSPRWSADSRSIAYVGTEGPRFGVMAAGADGGNARFIASVAG